MASARLAFAPQCKALACWTSAKLSLHAVALSVSFRCRVALEDVEVAVVL